MRCTGKARKVAAPIGVLLIAVGWLSVTVIFGITRNDLVFTINGDILHSLTYPWWVVSITGILMIIAASIHAIVDNQYGPVIGIITTILGFAFALGCGGIFFIVGYYQERYRQIQLRQRTGFDILELYLNYLIAAGVGASLGILGMIVLFGSWLFYRRSDEDNSRNTTV